MENSLPYDESTENAILGCVMAYPNQYDNMIKYITTDKIFYQKKARVLWRKLRKMKINRKPVDMLSVCSSLTKSEISNGITSHYISLLCSSNNLPLEDMSEFYSRQLYEKYLMRRVLVKTDEIRRDIEDNQQDVYKTIAESHSVLTEILNIRPSVSSDIESIISDTVHSIQNKEDKLIKTGYPKLDSFAGGLTRGEITIIGGRPGHGKTTVMVNMLANVLDAGYKAMFFSRELPNAELLKKIICLESQQLSYGMVRKNIFSEDALQIVNSTLEKIKTKYSNDRFLMFDNIRNFAVSSSEVKKFKPDIIFDDYIQLIACDSREDQRRLQIEQLVNDYKWLAKEADSVVVLASQLNRMIERAGTRGKTLMPQLSDLAESGAIEQVAENVFFSYYDYKVKGEAGKGKNIITMVAGKVRYGDSGTVDLGYDGDKCKIHNSIEEMLSDEIPF